MKGAYSNGQTRTLTSDSYALTWSASVEKVEGLSFSDGTLTVNESATAGTYKVQITATAVSGRSDGDKFVISGTVSSNSETGDYVYTVRARKEAGTSGAMTITITVTGTGAATSDYVEVPAGEIHEMTYE